MASTKLKFDRGCGFIAKYYAVAKETMGDSYESREVGSVRFNDDGKVVMVAEGFEHIVNSVDELEVNLSQLDTINLKVTFKVKKIDDSLTTLPHKFYGIRGTQVLISYDDEISGAEDLPDEIE